MIGVERRPQLVGHVGQELRLVLARLSSAWPCSSSARVQAGVVDRQGGLGRERLEQRDDLGRERRQAVVREITSPPSTRSSRSSGTASTERSPAASSASRTGWRHGVRVGRCPRSATGARGAPARPTAPSPSADRVARAAAPRATRRVVWCVGSQHEDALVLVVLVEDAAVRAGRAGGVADDRGRAPRAGRARRRRPGRPRRAPGSSPRRELLKLLRRGGRSRWR